MIVVWITQFYSVKANNAGDFSIVEEVMNIMSRYFTRAVQTFSIPNTHPPVFHKGYARADTGQFTPIV